MFVCMENKRFTMNGNINSYSRFLCKLLVCGLSYTCPIEMAIPKGVPFIVSVAKICVDLDAITSEMLIVNFSIYETFITRNYYLSR